MTDTTNIYEIFAEQTRLLSCLLDRLHRLELCLNDLQTTATEISTKLQ